MTDLDMRFRCGASSLTRYDRTRVAKSSQKILLGLTGGIGAGKSTVSETLKESGAEIIDADQISRELVEPGSPTLSEIVAAFPRTSILHHDGSLNRGALAEAVFSDDAHRSVLDSIMLPKIISRMREEAQASLNPIVVWDVALLIETGLHREVDAVCVVTAPPSLKLDRLEVRGLSRADAISRIAAQLSDRERLTEAHWQLDNTGSAADTRACALELYRQLNEIVSGC